MTQVVAPFRSRMIRMARAFPTEPGVGGNLPFSLTSEQIKIARHMNWDDASLAEIKAALGVQCCDGTLRKKLNALNILPRRVRGERLRIKD